MNPISLQLPVIGADAGQWPAKLNSDLSLLGAAVNALISAYNGQPAGGIITYTGTAWPTIPATPCLLVSVGYPSAPDPALSQTVSDASVWLYQAS